MELEFSEITDRALSAIDDMYNWAVINEVNIDTVLNIEKITNSIKSVKSDIENEWALKSELGLI